MQTVWTSKDGTAGNLEIQSRLKCAAGLADMACKRYKDAAKCFLKAQFDHSEFPEVYWELYQRSGVRGILGVAANQRISND